jgi:DNA-binding CsgD family transcriptional regulator
MSEALLSDRFTVMLGVRGVEDFRDELVRFTQWLGFDLVSTIVVIDRPMGESDFLAVDNAPNAYREMADDRDAGRVDPVMQHCKRFGTPMIWDRRTYVEGGAVDKWERQAPFGYRTGVAMALHLPGGKHFVIGVDRDHAMPRYSIECQRMVVDLCAFAAFAQEAAMRLLLPPVPREEFARLSARELEALKWAAEGKTAWEVGRILGISEQTVVRHVNNAAQKLGCVNKVQAVARAIRLGLLH